MWKGALDLNWLRYFSYLLFLFVILAFLGIELQASDRLGPPARAIRAQPVLARFFRLLKGFPYAFHLA